jgi:hypothetical protein
MLVRIQDFAAFHLHPGGQPASWLGLGKRNEASARLGFGSRPPAPGSSTLKNHGSRHWRATVSVWGAEIGILAGSPTVLALALSLSVRVEFMSLAGWSCSLRPSVVISSSFENPLENQANKQI